MDEQKLRKEFQAFHAVNHHNYSCDMAKIAKALEISRMTLYRWLHGKGRFSERQLAYIKNLLTDPHFCPIILLVMLHSNLYYIFAWCAPFVNNFPTITMAVKKYLAAIFVFLKKNTQNLQRIFESGFVEESDFSF